MRRPSAAKLAFLDRLLATYADTFEVQPLGQFAAAAGEDLPHVAPDSL